MESALNIAARIVAGIRQEDGRVLPYDTAGITTRIIARELEMASCNCNGSCRGLTSGCVKTWNTWTVTEQHPIFIPKGWQCPVCKQVYAPSVMMCWNCAPKGTTSANTDGFTIESARERAETITPPHLRDVVDSAGVIE